MKRTSLLVIIMPELKIACPDCMKDKLTVHTSLIERVHACIIIHVRGLVFLGNTFE